MPTQQLPSDDNNQLLTASGARWLQALLIVCLIVSSCLGPPSPVQANGIDATVSKVVPFGGFLVGWRHRNRVYRQSNNFIHERREYYDRLRETARQQLLDREIMGLRRSQTAAYIKVVPLIEHERKTVFQVAEGRKKQARRAFHDRVENSVIFAISGSRLAQQLFGAVKNGLGSADQLLVRVANSVSGGGGDALQDLAKIRRIADRISIVSTAVGGPVGGKLRIASQRLINAIDRPQAELLGGLENARAEIQGLNGYVDDLSRIGRAPSAGAVGHEVASRFLPIDGSQDISLKAIALILSELEVGDGSLKDEARRAIQAGFRARCAAISQAYQAQLAALNNTSSQDETEQTECNPIDNVNKFTADDESSQTQQGPPTDSGGSEPVQEPTEEEPESPPIVTASGAFSEPCNSGQCAVYGAQFTLTANFAEGVINGTVNAGADGGEDEHDCGDQDTGAVIDRRIVAISLGYTTSFSGSLAEDGTFSIPVSIAGSYKEEVTQPFTDETCLEFNQVPPYSGSWQEQGTISGYVGRDGSVELNTRWGSENIFQGSWSGTGEVTSP